jgi:hypothetical protein
MSLLSCESAVLQAFVHGPTTIRDVGERIVDMGKRSAEFSFSVPALTTTTNTLVLKGWLEWTPPTAPPARTRGRLPSVYRITEAGLAEAKRRANLVAGFLLAKNVL